MLWQRNALNNEVGYLSHENLLGDIGRYWNFASELYYFDCGLKLSLSHDHLVRTLVTSVHNNEKSPVVDLP